MPSMPPEAPKAAAGLPQEQADALLQGIMGDLGMPPAAPRKGRGQYARVALRMALPRVLAAVLALALLAALIIAARLFNADIHIGGIEGQTFTDEAGTVARVCFTVDREYLVKAFSAQLGEEMLPVERGETGYYVDCRQDGVLLLEVDAWNGAGDIKTVTVSGLGA